MATNARVAPRGGAEARTDSSLRVPHRGQWTSSLNNVCPQWEQVDE